MKIQKITPFLWFDNQAGEAANYYVSIFKDSRILNVTRTTAGGEIARHLDPYMPWRIVRRSISVDTP
jgi:predicted 3-demethylubiquinone-9 3-methyltransferase (glyoxalase superfamily)